MSPIAAVTADDPRWQALLAHSETYTCYSAALAAWAAFELPSWAGIVNSGLALTLVDAADGLFGFVHFPAGLRATLGLARRGADDSEEGTAGIMKELDRHGRVIVAGDGFALPWHVAAGRRHVPHWFVLTGSSSAPVVLDPFACRNDLGRQEATLQPVDPRSLASLAVAHPGDDEVVTLRESFALGDDARPLERRHFQWFERADADIRAAVGATGPDAISRLARHFREHGDRADAYRQVDDIWSIARHRGFLAQVAADAAARSGGALVEWVEAQVEPLAKRWSHMAPLLMQASLAIGAGRQPTGSVAETLDELADREAAADGACPADAVFLLLR